MRKKYRLVPEFGPEARFELKPAAAAPFRVVHENAFERLKNQLLDERLGDVWKPEESSWVRRAANEAAALAWFTPYPLLVFPVLFEEKAEAALKYTERQAQVRCASRDLLTA